MPCFHPILRNAPSTFAPGRFALATCGGALLLAACQKSDTAQQAAGAPIAAMALATSPPPSPAAYAPAAAALPPPASPVRYRPERRGDTFGYVERAYAMNRAFGDTPPDYTVDYDGERPWIWRAGNGAYRMIEQLPEGQRAYYYQAGASYPFYVVDPDGGYAYDGGGLVGVYAPDGSPIGDDRARARGAQAARYYARSNALYRAAINQQRHAAYVGEWRQRQPYLVRQQQAWDDRRARDPAWSDWHDGHRQDVERPWEDERQHRQAYATSIGAAALLGAATILTLDRDHGGHRAQAGPQGEVRPTSPALPQAVQSRRPPEPVVARAPFAPQRAMPAPVTPPISASPQRATPREGPPAMAASRADFRHPPAIPATARPQPGPALVGRPAVMVPIRPGVDSATRPKPVEPRSLAPRPASPRPVSPRPASPGPAPAAAPVRPASPPAFHPQPGTQPHGDSVAPHFAPQRPPHPAPPAPRQLPVAPLAKREVKVDHGNPQPHDQPHPGRDSKGGEPHQERSKPN